MEPVELRGIRRGHRGPARGTGGTGAHAAHTAEERIWLVGSTGPTDRFRQNRQNCLQYYRFHLVFPKRDGSLAREKCLCSVTDEHLMNALSWASIAEQLRAIGVEVPVTVPPGNGDPAAHTDHVVPSQPDVRPQQRPSRVDKPNPDPLTTILAAAKKAGVTFLERVSDGDLVVEGLDHLAPDDQQKLQAKLHDVRSELLSTASLDLLAKLGVEMVYADTEQRAATEVQRICGTSRTIGLDIETAPLPQFLPKAWPIAVTKDGRRSKLQPKMDTSPGLDPFWAEIRLLQIAAEIDGKTVVLVIDLRRVPLGSPALAPLWRCKMIGHNLSFDAKMLVANGVPIADRNLIDTILMAGLGIV